MHAELLINAEWVIPVEAPGHLDRHSIAIADGRILAILPSYDAVEQIMGELDAGIVTSEE